MRFKLLILSALLMLSGIISGQELARLKVRVLFDNDKYKLKKTEQAKIDSAIALLSGKEFKRIFINGHTDSDADSLYNMKLSENRCNTVASYLKKKKFNAALFKISYLGENKPIKSNKTDQGKQSNRRADIIFLYVPDKVNSESEKDTIETLTETKKDSCKGVDTTIFYPDGTQITFNRCEYLRLFECLEIRLTNTTDAIDSAGLSLVDVNGVPMASCGMLNIGLKPGCEKMDCFDVPVVVRVPVAEPECDICGRRAQVFNLGPDGWDNRRGKKGKVEQKKIEKRLYNVFTIYCPNKWKNCDCRINGKKMKFKAPAGHKIVSLVVKYECPTIIAGFKPMKHRKNVAKQGMPCNGRGKTVTATIVDQKGDTLILTERPLTNLRFRFFFNGCARNGDSAHRVLFIIPHGSRDHYSKYKIKKRDLKKP